MAARINPVQELRRTVLACLLFEDGFYEDGKSVANRITELVSKVKPEVAAALAIEARTLHNLRHVPMHIALAMTRIGGEHRRAVGKLLPQILLRADEPAEFLAMYWKDGKVPLAKQVQKGLAAAIRRFDEYALAKYNRDGAVKLRDVLFMSHAEPAPSNICGPVAVSPAKKHRGSALRHLGGQGALWTRLVEGKLATPDTWEVQISACKEKGARKEIWERLILERKLGAMALLRNLRNITQDGVSREIISAALRVADYSRVLPFRFIAAARAVPQLEPYIEHAMLGSLDGAAKIPGSTVLLVDVSGSMDAALSARSDLKRIDAAAGLAMLARELFGDVRVFTFSYNLVEVPARRGFAGMDAVIKSQQHGGTYLANAITAVSKQVKSTDRLIVITDEQSHDNVAEAPLREFGRKYMINVGTNKNGVGYGSWVHLDGFSEAVIKWISAFEKMEVE